MPAVPPTTRIDPSVDMSFLLVALPGVDPAVGVPGGRLGGVRVDPADAALARVEEPVSRAHAREHDVTRAQRRLLAVKNGLDLTVEEEIGFLERVVVDLRGAARLVVDSEHGLELRAED